MINLLKSKDLQLRLSFSGKIIQVLVQNISDVKMKKDESILRYIDEKSHFSMLNLLAECNTNGYSFTSEMRFYLGGNIVTTSLFMFKKEEECLLINLNESENTIRVLEDIMRINNELTNQIRHIYEVKQEVSLEKNVAEISKLNNVLVDYQREISKKNAELELLNKTLVEYSFHDDLTKLRNRRKFFLDIKEILPKESVKIVLIDFNYFKKVNDMFGHSKGDIVLQEFGKKAKDHLESFSGKAYRVGGDEFVFIIPLKSNYSFYNYVDNFNKFLKQYHSKLSLAFAEKIFPLQEYNEETFKDLVAELDDLMYHYKEKVKKENVK